MNVTDPHLTAAVAEVRRTFMGRPGELLRAVSRRDQGCGGNGRLDP